MRLRRRGPRSVLLIGCLLAVVALPVGAAAAAPSVAPGDDTSTPGTPAAGKQPDGSVRGFVDAHNHTYAHEAFGGRMICGKPFDPAGIAAAMQDCPDHHPDGSAAVVENLLSTGSPFGTHDPGGWPTFREWPAHDSLTHQQQYHAWLERAWRGGLRIMVNDLVANRQLCDVYWLKQNSCNEMDTIRLEARRTRELEAYVDGLNGGPGRGWFRIVTSPAQARAVVAQGKLAVVLGVETSEPFGCRQVLDVPLCSRRDIDRGLDELKALGVSSAFACHKFDNALCGVRFDGDTKGSVVQLGNVLGSVTSWSVRTCTGAAHDNPVQTSSVPQPHCNTRGLTALGEYAIRGMMRRGMVVEVDHMSVKAADRTLAILEEAGYGGVVSSHSWTDPTFLPRIWALGGFVTQYASVAPDFVAEWRRTAPERARHGVTGYGWGLDSNGFGAQPGPDTGGPQVRYPFRTADGAVTVDRLTTGQRTWDVNADGVAHYGLTPDWVESLRLTGGQPIVDDLLRGAEAYLRTWERATGS